MAGNPLVTVLLPVYNCENYVYDAVQSILNQTYDNFELLIIDDCSTDNTLKICKSFQDPRIIIIEKEQNSGYTNSLNYGISIAKGKYIARMDGDDISLPERFEKQVGFLENNVDVVLCGTAIQKIGSGQPSKQPLKHEEIKAKLCLKNPFYHPTIIGKSDIFKNNLYDSHYEPAEDYELWTRLVFKYKVANLNDVFLMYRIHQNQVSITKRSVQKYSAYKCKLKTLDLLEIEKYFSHEQLEMVFHHRLISTKADCTIALKIFNKLIYINTQKRIFDFDSFDKIIKEYQLKTFKIYLSNNSIWSFKTILFIFQNSSVQLFMQLLKHKLRKILSVKKK